jgi:primosomal protein N' (replication factor Y)
LGLGTQKLAELLKAQYPHARIARLDRDVMTKKKAMDDILNEFAEGSIDILLGTQMIAKGLDFANVTLVGVLQADTGLSHGFRAAERTFQLLTQVSGRGGRGDKAGLTIIQTNNPTHYVMQHAKLHDYTAFFAEEMQYRKLRHYPPYRFIATIALEGRQFDDVAQAALLIKNQLQGLALDHTQILGPTTPYIARLNGYYRLRILVKYFHKDAIMPHLRDLYWQYARHAKLRLYVDFDTEDD